MYKKMTYAIWGTGLVSLGVILDVRHTGLAYLEHWPCDIRRNIIKTLTWDSKGTGPMILGLRLDVQKTD